MFVTAVVSLKRKAMSKEFVGCELYSPPKSLVPTELKFPDDATPHHIRRTPLAAFLHTA